MTRPDAAGRALVTDGRELGLRRVVVETTAGPVVVRTGRAAGGAATILLHGAAGSWTTWTPLLQASDRAGTPLTDVVALDLPGWGETPAPRGDALTPATAAGVVAEVAAALGHARWQVLGHSLGGVVALQLAATHPRATERVGLVSPTGPGVLDVIRHPVLGARRLPWFAGMLLAMRTLDALPKDGHALLALLQRLGALGPLSAPLFADRGRLDPSVVAALAEEIRPEAFTRAVRAAAETDLDVWRAITCPVRAVRGARDVFVGRDDAAGFAALIPDFRETVLAGAGHFAAVERPDEVLPLLLA